MTTTPKERIAPDDALVIDLRDLGILSTGSELDNLFARFCGRNSRSIWRFELSPDGEIIVLPPVNYPGDFHENDMATDLRLRSREYGGESTGSNAAYRMQVTGGILSPDAAWTSPERWAAYPHPPGEPHPVCPDFVVEIRSTYDNLAPLHAKMRLYMQNGALLGWLIDPSNRRVYIYRAGQTEAEPLESPPILSGEDVLPGFTFDVARWIFDRT